MNAQETKLMQENAALKLEIQILKSKEQKLNEILNESNALVFNTYFLSSSELFIQHPEYFLNVLGYNKNEKHDFDFKEFMLRLHPDDISDISRRMNILFNKREKCFCGIFRLRHKDGRYIWFFTRIKYSGIEEMTGNACVNGIIVVFSDMFCTDLQIAAYNKELLLGKDKNIKHRLTKHEITILKYIANGYNVKEISKMLGMSISTLKSIKRTMLDKTGAKNSPELVKYLFTHGLY